MAKTLPPPPDTPVSVSLGARLPSLDHVEAIEVRLIIDAPGENHRIDAKEDKAEVARLAESFKHNPQLHPICVYPAGDGKFGLVFGHRRTAAAKLVGWKTINASVLDEKPDALTIEAIRSIENLHRQNLNAIEEALACSRVLDRVGGDIEKAAIAMGMPVAWVEARKYLYRLSPKVKDLVARGQVNLGQAREIAKLGDQDEQLRIAEDIKLDPTEEYRGRRLYTIEEVANMVAMRRHALKVVPWELAVPFAGKVACTGCPDNSATKELASLFGPQDKDSGGGYCHNPACFEAKEKAVEKAKEATAAKIAKEIQSKKLTKEDAGGAAAVRKFTPDFAKTASVQRHVRKELGLVEAPASKPASSGRPDQEKDDLTPEKRAIIKFGKAIDDWRDDADNAFTVLCSKDPHAWAAIALLGSVRMFEKLEYSVPADKWGFYGNLKSLKAAPPLPEMPPGVARIIDAAGHRDYASLMTIAGEADRSIGTYAEGLNIQRLTPEVIGRLARSLGVTISKPAPVWEAFAPKAPAAAAEKKAKPAAKSGRKVIGAGQVWRTLSIANNENPHINKLCTKLIEKGIATFGDLIDAMAVPGVIDWTGGALSANERNDFIDALEGSLRRNVCTADQIRKDIQAAGLKPGAMPFAWPSAAPETTASPEPVGRCRVCGCTDDRKCPGGCEWVNDAHDLCSNCGSAASKPEPKARKKKA